MKGLLFTYLMTGGGAICGIARPYIGVLIYVCFSIIKPEALWWHTVPIGNYSRIVAVSLLLGWCLHGFGDWRFGRGRGILVCLFGFMLWAMLLVPASLNPSLAWSFIDIHLKIFLPVLVGICMIQTVQHIKQLVWVIVLSEGYLCYEFNNSYYGGWNMLQEIGFAGADNNTVAISIDTCIGLAFFLGLHVKSWWWKGLLFGLVVLMMNAVMFSFSRGGLLGLIVTGGVGFLLIPKKPRHYFVLVLVILIGARLAGPQVLKRFGTVFADKKERDGSAAIRVKHWTACGETMVKTPWGVGPNQWRYTAPSFNLPPMEAHSYWMQTGAELGFPGLMLLVLAYLLCLKRLWPLAREKVKVSDPWLTHLSRMIIAAIVGFSVSAQFVSVQGTEMPFFLLLLGAGVLKVVSRDPVAYPPPVALAPIGLWPAAPARLRMAVHPVQNGFTR